MSSKSFFEQLLYDYLFLKNLDRIHLYPPVDSIRIPAQSKEERIQDSQNGMTIDRFTELSQEEAEVIPEPFYQELNLGIVVEEGIKTNPETEELVILGEYNRSILGNQIKLYYGSFQKVLGQADENTWKKKIREVLRHEFRHHMEGRVGRDDLEREDREEIRKFWRQRRNQ